MVKKSHFSELADIQGTATDSNVGNEILVLKKPFPTSETNFWEPKNGFRRWNRKSGSQKMVSDVRNGILAPRKRIPTWETDFWFSKNGFRARKRNFDSQKTVSDVGNAFLIPKIWILSRIPRLDLPEIEPLPWINHMVRLILFLLLGPFLGGCISAARQLEPSVVGQVKVGVSTRVDVEQTFGKPFALVTDASRRSVAEYFYIMASPPSPTLRRSIFTRTFSVLYDPQGVVVKTVQSESSKPINKGVAGSSIGNPFVLTGWMKGKTRVSSITQAYGPPDFKTLTTDGHLVLGWIYASRPKTQMTGSVERFMTVVDEDGVVLDFKTIAGPERYL